MNHAAPRDALRRYAAHRPAPHRNGFFYLGDDLDNIIRSPHPNTLLVLQRLRECQPDELVLWEELSLLIGLDSREEGRHYVSSARRMMRRDGVVFESKKSEGVHRMTDEQVALRRMPWRRRKERSQARLTIEEGQSVNFSAISPEAQRELTVALETAGRILHFTNLKFVEEEKMRVNLNPPPPPPPLLDG